MKKPGFHPQQVEARAEPFGYVCHACNRCCRNKIIQINPYEIARLARHLGISTREFRERWTENGTGTVLAINPDQSCVFLSAEGCSVHPDRPLVCRLYPLGRIRRAEGTESFTHVTPVKDSAGEYTQQGTIGEFLELQDAQPFIDAADGYVEWVNAAVVTLDGFGGSVSIGLGYASLLDLEEAVREYCKNKSRDFPDDIEQQKELHLSLLYDELDAISGGDHGKD